MPYTPAPDETPASGYVPAPDEAPSDGFQPTQYGFQVKPIDLGGGKQSVQREDGAVYFGADQGNKGKPGWFNDKGLRLGDKPGADSSIRDRAINDMLLKTREVESKPLLGRIIPPAVSSVAQGGIEAITAPAQYLGHKMGITAMDKPMDEFNRFNQETFVQDPVARGMGAMALPTKAIGNAPLKASQKVTELLRAIKLGKAAAPIANVATAAGTGRIAAQALTPEYDIKDEADFEARKNTEGNIGMALGGGAATAAEAIPAVGALTGAINKRLSRWGKTPAVQELLDTLGTRIGGETPGIAAQKAAWKQYDAAWDEFKTAIAPVDAASGGAGMDYSGPIATLKKALGVGGKRSPAPMEPESAAYLKSLLANLDEASVVGGGIDNSAAGAIDTIKQLGAAQRRLASRHGETESREMLNEVRDSILKAIEDSHPKLAGEYANAREIFRTKVAPLFDKSEGGNFLTQLRDTKTPDDWIGAGNQGQLTRMKADKMGIVAKGSSPDPLLFSMLDSAIKQANGNPGAFVTSIEKAMPGVAKIADPEMLQAFQGLARVARTAKFTGWLANMAGTAAAGSMGGAGAAAAAGSAAVGLHLKPGFSAPGLLWKLFQAPATRKLLSVAGKLPAGSPELELLAGDLAKAMPVAAPRLAPNVSPLRTLPTAASTEPNTTLAENQP